MEERTLTALAEIFGGNDIAKSLAARDALWFAMRDRPTSGVVSEIKGMTSVRHLRRLLGAGAPRRIYLAIAKRIGELE